MTRKENGPYSMPMLMPEYPPPPYRLGPLEGSNFLCTLPSQVLASLVPEPLETNADGVLWIYFVHIGAAKPLLLPYREVGLFVPVTYDGKQGLFSLAMFLDESLPITIGREVWGFPKRFADSISLEREGDRCSSKLVHDGSTLLDATFRVAENKTQQPSEQLTRVYTHRVIPSWQSDKPSINQIVALNWTSTNEMRQAASEAKLRVAFPADSQLSVLNEMCCIKSWYSKTEACTLAGGEVVRDFLSSS
ncbi:MAG: acetoacetate decarboxylase family protein [Planctomycetes bacterium]|nr:acetoacetate decarboxylase family protein [Planctomycetota bacterium]